MVDKGLIFSKDFVENLAAPRVIFIYIPSGEAVDKLADELTEVLEEGDIIVDGGYVHAGPPGAGHFVKLVHNGMEYGMLQAIGEGMALLENSPLKLDIPNVLDVYTHGSVIRSWLIELMRDSYQENKGMDGIDSYVDDTGEVNWLVNDAMCMEVSAPVIAAAVMQCVNTRDKHHNTAKAVAMMRHGFGGHAYGPSQVSQEERYRGRVGGYYFLGKDPNEIKHSSDK